MYQFFETFLKKMVSSFRRISVATKNEFSVDDLHGEAWLVADEISRRRGHDIDFSDPDDANLVLRGVNLKTVKRGDWHMRKSVRIDQDSEGDDGAIKWSERLPAHASSDPLVSLLLRESALNADHMLVSSYSQAAAYVMVFVNFKNNRQDVCAYLVISDGTLSRRITVAANTVRVQPSLFDRVERIGAGFMPPPGRYYTVKPARHYESTQWGWEF